MQKQILKLSIFLVVFFALPVFVHATTYYVDNNATNDSGSGSISSPKKYIKSGIALLYAGDTLAIKDGTYIGAQNMMNYCEGDAIWQTGTADAWIIIKAEHDGGVIIDGQGTGRPLCLKGNDLVDGQNTNYTNIRYFEFRGLIMKNSNQAPVVSASCTDHLKFINIGAAEPGDGNTSVISMTYNTDNLIEGCYVWGSGRYKIALFHSYRNVIRNCVARMDRANATVGGDPSAVYSVYSSTEIEVQNSIAIDGDHPEFWLNVNEFAGAFANPATTDIDAEHKLVDGITGKPVIYTNDIAINNKTRFAVVADNAYIPDIYMNNCVGINHITMAQTSLINGRGNIALDKCTLVDVDNQDAGVYAGAYFLSWPGNEFGPHNYNGARNTIWYNFQHGGLFYDNAFSEYNNVYNVEGLVDVYNTISTNTKTLNPATNGLLYPVRIENGSTLETAGKNNERLGANIIKQYGKSGTMYGEPGYNLLQDGTNGQADVNLWPFPNEDLIKSKMQEYSYTGPFCATPGALCIPGGNATISGNRGFASSTAKQLNGTSDVTLTSYIWEALGNPIPPEIYGESSDTTPPSAPTGLSVQ